MANYLWNAGGSGDSLLESSDPYDVDGEYQFDIRMETGGGLSGVASSRTFEDTNGVIYIARSSSGQLSARIYDGTAHTFSSSANVDADAILQYRAVIDATSNPITCDFYQRPAGTPLSDDTGWVQVGVQQTIAAAFGGQLQTQHPYCIGYRLGTASPFKFMRAYLAYGASNTVAFDLDVTNLSDAEVDAGVFVDAVGNEWVAQGSSWWYAQPGRNGAGNNYLSLPAVSGSNPTVDNTEPFAVDTDIEVEAWFTLEDLTPSGQYQLASGYSANTGWYFAVQTSGSPVFVWGDGTAAKVAQCNTALDTRFSAGDLIGLKVTVDVDNGAGDCDTKFYTSSDGSTWTQLGATVSLGATSTIADTVLTYYRIGDFDIVCGMRRLIVRNGIGAADAANFDFTNLSARDLRRAAFSEYVNGYKVNLLGDEWAYVRPKTSIAGKTPTLLLEAGDGNKGHSKKWADRSGNDLHAQLGSAAGADTNDPVFLPYNSEKYVWLPGAVGNNAQCSRSALTDDFSVLFDGETDNWSDGGDELLVDARNAAGGAVGIRLILQLDGDLQISWYDPGLRSYTFTAPPLVDGSRHEIRVDRDASAGTLTLYIDGTQADQITGTETAAISEDASPVFRVGESNTGTGQFDGKIYRAALASSVAPSSFDVVDVVFADATEPYATFTERANSATVTINRAASGYVSTVVDRDMWVLSTDDYMLVADNNLLDFDTADDFTVVAAVRPSLLTGGALGAFLSKEAGAAGWILYHSGSGTSDDVQFQVRDGTVSPLDSITDGVAVHTLTVLAGRRDATANEIEVFVDGVGSGTPTTDTTTATQANAVDLNIGRRGGGVSYVEGQIVAVAVFREALTDDEVAAVGNALLGIGRGSATTIGAMASLGQMLET